MGAQPNYSAREEDYKNYRFLVMEDHMGPLNLSLTNCIEYEIPKVIPNREDEVLATVYRDTEGMWDVVYRDEEQREYKFHVVSADTKEEAMDEAIAFLLGKEYV